MNYLPLLCIDTSTPTGSIALAGRDGPMAVHTQMSPGAHTEQLFTTCRALLKECGVKLSGLGGVAVAAGPGSFTGIRIAASVAKTLAWANSKPLFAVGSLESLASGAARLADGIPVCALLDAGQSELYAACYQWEDSRTGRPGELLAPCALSIENLCPLLERISVGSRIICLGGGFRSFHAEILASLGEQAVQAPESLDLPNAASLGELAMADPEHYRVEDIPAFEPFYVRVGRTGLRLKS